MLFAEPYEFEMLYFSIISFAIVCMCCRTNADSYTQILLNAYGTNYTLPPLPFATGDLEPYIDNATVNVHYYGHHQAYTNRMNALLTSWRATVRVIYSVI